MDCKKIISVFISFLIIVPIFHVFTRDSFLQSPPPAVSNEYLHVDFSGCTGADGLCMVGDILTFTWDNSLTGDNNPDVVSVFADLGGFVFGAVNVQMYDDGANGDAVADDEIWTAVLTVAIRDNYNGHLFAAVATDSYGNSSEGINQCGGSTICNCGDTVVADYYFTSDLDCSGTGSSGLLIGADGITIDGNGRSMTGFYPTPMIGSVNMQAGIKNLGYNNVTIKNLHIEDFFIGIGEGGITSMITGLTIENNTITSNILYDLSYVFPVGIFIANSDHNIISGNSVSGFNTGISLDNVTNNEILSNIVSSAESGIKISSGSNDTTIISDNFIKMSGVGLSISNSTNDVDVTVSNNTLLFNLEDVHIGYVASMPNFINNISGHNYAHKMIEFGVEPAKILNQGDLATFAFSLKDATGADCPDCEYVLETNPAEVLTINKIGSSIEGSFEVSTPGIYSLQIAVLDSNGNSSKKNNLYLVDSIGASTILSNATTYYIRPGVDPIHGQFKGRDGGSSLLDPPSNSERQLCTYWVLNHIDEIPSYPFSAITSQAFNFMYKADYNSNLTMRRNSLAQSYYYPSVAPSSEYVNFSTDFSGLSWVMDYPFSWYHLNFVFGKITLPPMSYPHILTTPEQPSTNVITHNYTTTPAIKYFSDPEAIFLSANLMVADSPLATVVLDGAYAADNAVQVTLDNYNYPFRTQTTRIHADGTATLMANNVTTKTSFESVNMAVTPDSGYVDVEIIDWIIGAGYYKRWVETGDVGVGHQIANMAPNYTYDIKVDGVVYTTVDSDSSGVITFHYGGPFSTHVFEVSAHILGGSYEQLPTTPADLTCQALNSTTIRWLFKDTSLNEKGFRLYGPEGLIWSSGPDIVTDLSYIDETGLTPETLYSGRYVTTIAPAGESTPSNLASCTTLADSEVNLPISVPDISSENILPSGVYAGNLVKRADITTVYFIGADNKRHTFPNENTYYSWFEDFSGIKIISAADLAAITMGSNVTMRPGTYLVKIQADPKVYAVEPYGVLRWISSETIAGSLYGAVWNTKIADVEPTFFSDYQMGEPVTANIHPTGSVFSYENDVKVYYMEQVKKRYISTASFLGNKFRDQFINRNISALIIYEIGEDLPVMRIEDLITWR